LHAGAQNFDIGGDKIDTEGTGGKITLSDFSDTTYTFGREEQTLEAPLGGLKVGCIAPSSHNNVRDSFTLGGGVLSGGEGADIDKPPG